MKSAPAQDQPPTPFVGCLGEVAACAAIAFWSLVFWFVLPKLDINPWWSIAVGSTCLAGFVALRGAAEKMAAIAGARWVERQAEAPDLLATLQAVAEETATAKEKT